MSIDLPPQFIDENGEEFCITCLDSGNCILAGLKKNIQDIAEKQAVALHPSAVGAEIAVRGIKKTTERHQAIDELTLSLEERLDGHCLISARDKRDVPVSE